MTISRGILKPRSRMNDPRLLEAFELYHKNPKKGMGWAMRKAGYSDTYANNPGLMTRTNTWQELTKKYLGDDRLLKLHSQLLDSAMIQEYSFPTSDEGIEFSDQQIKEIIESVPGCVVKHIRKLKNKQGYVYEKVAFYLTPDNKSRREALDMAYKVQGKYQPDKILVKPEFGELSDDELQARIDSLHRAVRGETAHKKDLARDKL